MIIDNLTSQNVYSLSGKVMRKQFSPRLSTFGFNKKKEDDFSL